MINVEIVKNRIDLENQYRDLKLKIEQKETVLYYNYKNSDEGGKDRSAKDKIMDSLKMKDENLINLYVEFNDITCKLNNIKIVFGVLEDLVRRNDISLDYFKEYQDSLLDELGIM